VALQLGLVFPGAKSVISRFRRDLSRAVRDKAVIWIHTRILGMIEIRVEQR
jgi:hypothetical protein